MPRPSLTEEIMNMAVQWANAREMPGGHADALARFDAMVDRLTALETELEGYRNREALAAVYAKLSPGWDKLPDTTEPWPTPLLDIANENLRAWMERHPNPSALPCSSEYVNAQKDSEHD